MIAAMTLLCSLLSFLERSDTCNLESRCTRTIHTRKRRFVASGALDSVVGCEAVLCVTRESEEGVGGKRGEAVGSVHG